MERQIQIDRHRETEQYTTDQQNKDMRVQREVTLATRFEFDDNSDSLLLVTKVDRLHKDRWDEVGFDRTGEELLESLQSEKSFFFRHSVSALMKKKQKKKQ